MSELSVQELKMALEQAKRKTEPMVKIAYIVSRFPKISETFILHEILEVERLGVPLEVYSLLRQQEPVVHPEAEEMVKRVHFHPFVSLQVLFAHWYFIWRRPRAYFKMLAEVLGGTFGSPKFFVRAIVILPKSVRFAYEMEKQGITHIHAQFATHPTVTAYIAHRLTGIPFSFTARGSDVHVDRRMLKEKLDASAFAITVSSYNKELMVDECGSDARDKIHVIYGGIDTDVISPHLREHTSNGLFQILCVARFEEVKGHTYLVEACRLLRDRGVDFECHLVGGGEASLRRTIEKQIERAGLGEKIRLHGSLTYAQVIERLSHADVGVLATVPTADGKREGIPNVLKEAMACGLPVVASSISGIPELVDHETSGLLVPPRDAGALADALQRLNDSPALRDRMGRAGREKIVREFSLRNNVARRVKLFLNGTPN